MRVIKSFIILSMILVLAGCSSSTGSYTSMEESISNPVDVSVFKKNLNYEGVKRNPIIVVHGFLGANLVNTRTQENVWGSFKTADAFSVSDERMQDLSHPMGYQKSLNELKDDVIADKLLESVRVKVLGVPFEMPAYKDMIDILVGGGYVPSARQMPKDKHFYSLFEFAYDWRRDLPENAVALGAFIREKRAYMQKEYKIQYGIKDYDVQFDVIGHSMGGLLSRYYLMYGEQDLPEDGSLPKLNWEGSNYIDRLVIVATPNSGYLDTFLEMLRGTEVPPFPPAVLATLPTYYQMLPAPETNSIVYSDDPDGVAVDVFDPTVWERMHWGLASKDADEALKILLPDTKTKEERKAIAMDHLSKCLKRAKQFIAAMQVEENPPNDVKLNLFLGYGIKTTKCAFINRKNGSIDSLSYDSGDGKILVTSTLCDLNTDRGWSYFLKSPIPWSKVTILRAAHMGITKDPTFADNILFMLMSEETVKQKRDLSKISYTDKTSKP